MPPKKKKKSQLKPIDRGFATTSVPKKVTPPPETEDTLENAPPSDELEEKATGNSAELAGTQTSVKSESEDAQEQASQALVDKYQEKTEKEISRTVKLIEADRRYSKTFPLLDLDGFFKEEIFSLISESKRWDEPRPLEEPEEKLIARLAITYGVLRRLGFSESRVDECLRSIPGIELDEAYEWLTIHCSEEELEDKDKGLTEQHEPRTPRTPSTFQSDTPQSPRTPSQFLAEFSQPKVKRLDAGAPAFIPRYLQTTSSGDASATDEEIPPSTPHSRTAISTEGSQVSTDNESEISDVDDPNMEYVRLKLKYHELQTVQKLPPTHQKLQRLQERICSLKGDALFDERSAETQFRSEKTKVEKRNLQNLLRDASSRASDDPFSDPHIIGTAINKPKKVSPKEVSVPTEESVDAGSPVSTNNILDGDDDDSSLGGILGLLEPMSVQDTTSDGRTITLREMGLPKQWVNRTPKLLLRDCVAKIDRYAAISYNTVSGASRAKRASVSVLWEGRKRDEWVMDDVACPDEVQAEQYIATVALHALTYPETEGFAGGNRSSAGNPTFFRSLPAAFRDLWDELEEKRKLRDDGINRVLWEKLRALTEAKVGATIKSSAKQNKPALERDYKGSSRFGIESQETFNPQLAESFAARQASPMYQEMLLQRNSLPIAEYRQTIIQTLEDSQVVVLSGETGCGKSTQVPAFILEDHLARGKACRVYCTEPRRISAISLAQRVSRELGEPANVVGTNNSLVGYSIRLESNISRNTRLAYVTNGIALRMLEGGSGSGGQGTAFDEITHVIIDEVHERTIESDFLLIVLKTLIRERPDLKVILMSATVDADKISEYFGGCPTLHVPGRTFPVDVRFLEDAIEFTKWKITEGSPYARRLDDRFYKGKNRPEWTEELLSRDEDDESDIVAGRDGAKLEKRYSADTVSTLNLIDDRIIPYELIVRLLEKVCFEDAEYLSYSSAVLVFMPGMGEIRRLHDMLVEHPRFGSTDFKLYPLHSTLSSENQGAVFDIPPRGVRKVVIATNIAETGITIPDITCVIDTGKHREMRFDEKRQISRLIETFIAKSNAAQRRGRAGRVQRGLCFHLFTKMRHDTQMADHPLPEIMRLSLSDLSLRIKIMKVRLGSSIEDVLSKALDPPVSINVQRAVSMLVEVRALTTSEDITPLGRLLSKLPTDVHLGKFLLIATVFRCLDPALTIAAALNSKSPFVTPLGLEHEADRAKNSYRIENSDFLTIHNAFSSWRRACGNTDISIYKFCHSNYLSHQNLQQIEELRQQFLGFLVDTSFIQVDRSFIRELGRARYGRNRTRFVNVPPEYDTNSMNVALVNAALVAGLYPKILSVDSKTGQMRTITNNQSVSFHPSSVNFGKKPSNFGVNHLGYFTIMHSKKLYAWETGPVEDLAMLLLCGECDFKLSANYASIDRKIKLHISPKTNVAIKLLREHLFEMLSMQFRGQPLTETRIRWNDLAMMVLGKTKPKDEKEQTSITFIT